MSASTIKLDATEHKITAVTVFKLTAQGGEKAEVFRKFELDLKVGSNQIEITKLPNCLDSDSVRVQGVGNAVLSDVSCSLPKPGKTSSSVADSKSDVIRELEAQKAALLGEKTVRTQQADLLFAYGKTMKGDNARPEEMGKFLQDFLDFGRENLAAVGELDKGVQEVERKLVKAREELHGDSSELKRGAKINVVVIAKEAGKVELSLSYVVSKAHWTPVYDLRTTTENGKPSPSVSLHYRAAILQLTGEDWTDVTLTLSTASPEVGTAIPAVPSLKIKPGRDGLGLDALGKRNNAQVQAQLLQQQHMQMQMQMQRQQHAAQQPAQLQQQHLAQQIQPQIQQQFQLLQQQQQRQQPVQQRQTVLTSGLFGSAPQAATAPPPTDADTSTAPPSPSIESVEESEADLESKPFEHTVTVASESAIAVTFQIEGQSTIPSQSSTRTVSIAVIPLNAKMEYVVVPRAKTTAFLQCEVENTSQYNLLAGPVSIWIDGGFLAKSSINDVSPREVFMCSLGPDPSLRVSFASTSKKIPPPVSIFATGSVTTSCRSVVTLKNKRQTAVKNLVVKDCVPVPSESRYAVVIKQPGGFADAKEKNAKKLKDGLEIKWTKKNLGQFLWQVEIGPGEEVQLEVAYEVISPLNTSWIME